MGRPHFKVNGQLYLKDKTWKDLSEKQKNWITELIQEQLKYEDKTKYKQISEVMDQIKQHGIWIPQKEVTRRFHQLQQRKQRRSQYILN